MRTSTPLAGLHLYYRSPKMAGQWIRVANGERIEEAEKLFMREIGATRLTMAFDTGVTGLIYRIGGYDFAFIKNWSKIVDLRKDQP